MARGYEGRHGGCKWSLGALCGSVMPQAHAPVAGFSTSTVRTCALGCGGIRPHPRRRSPGRLSFAEREDTLADRRPYLRLDAHCIL